MKYMYTQYMYMLLYMCMRCPVLCVMSVVLDCSHTGELLGNKEDFKVR